MPFAARRLDHVVLAARDADTQVDLFRRLGFRTGEPSRHPWGTRNRTIQFEGTFLNLVAVDQEWHGAADPDPSSFSFPAFIEGFLTRHEGAAMLALSSTGAGDDSLRFRKAGLGDFGTFHFERSSSRADGSVAAAGFTLAYARSPQLPDIGFFTCQHHHPATFWNAALQDHPNGVTGVTGVVIVADTPADHAEFLSAFTGQREMRSTSMGLDIALGSDVRLEVLTPAGYRFRYGLDEPGQRPRLRAVRLRTRDMNAVRNILDSAAMAAADRNGTLVVPAGQAGGTVLVFEPA